MADRLASGSNGAAQGSGTAGQRVWTAVNAGVQQHGVRDPVNTQRTMLIEYFMVPPVNSRAHRQWL